MLYRDRLTFLASWLDSDDRKPLIIRGARQVGKTWLVRQFCELYGKKLIELNFEKNPQLSTLFSSNDPNEIILNLSGVIGEEIDLNNSILFFDEIQSYPELIAKLRWFAEDLPALPVIGAGSLLEFILEDYPYSMPVGRINYMYLEPMFFEEFLKVQNQQLYDLIQNYQLGNEIPRIIHEKLSVLFKEYIIVGGMPEVVATWLKDKSLTKVSQKHLDIISTYRDDFSKYKTRLSTDLLDHTMMAIPKHLGDKFVFSQITPLFSGEQVKKALSVLNKARICHPVVSCAANGLPLSAESNPKFMKQIFIDVGFCSAALGLELHALKSFEEINLINKGGIAEQVAGQLLRTLNPPYKNPELHYWQREKKGSSAEVDYIIQFKNHVVPVEIKAGTTGTLKSLHVFMGLKKPSLAVRINSGLPSIVEVSANNSMGQTVKYNLLSIPFYLVGQCNRLLDKLI